MSEFKAINRIRKLKMSDEEKALLCFALADGKPMKLPDRYANYLLALIHNDWARKNEN